MTHYTKGLLGAVLCCAVVAASPGPNADGAPFCSLSTPPLDVWPGMTFVLGSFTDDVADVGVGPIRPSGRPGHLAPPTADTTVWGQSMQLSGAGGWAAETVYDAGGGAEQEAIVVLWDYDPGCSVTRYTGVVPFVEPGAQALVRGRLRDENAWIDGVPTLDTFLGGALVFPAAVLATNGRLPGASRVAHPSLFGPHEGALSAAEAFELMSALPEPCEELWNPALFAAKATTVSLAYMDDQRYPVPGTLRVLEARGGQPERARARCLGDPREVSIPW